MNPTPKEVFQKDSNRLKRHFEIVDDPAVVTALHTAFAQFCWDLKAGQEVQSSLHSNSMREGARQFMTEFLTLADKPKPKVIPASDLETES